MGNQSKRVKVNIDGKSGNFGTVGKCIEKIREYLNAPDKDPKLKEKKDKAIKATEYLAAVFDVAIKDVEFMACAADNMWIQ